MTHTGFSGTGPQRWRAWGLAVLPVFVAAAALVAPNEVRMPGTQPREAPALDDPAGCLACHSGVDPQTEPGFNWQGSLMANATRDPLFWATLAIAEQDFDGSGDLCLRCHSYAGWAGGRSTPTDGSALTARDRGGVDCDTCHKMTNPDNSEHAGVMRAPFIANDGGAPATGYYGSGMLSVWPGAHKLGPHALNIPQHAAQASRFHRSGDFCGCCHDVSNPVTGDLAENPASVPGGLLTEKAAFQKFPYEYGVVERTYSEFKASAFSRTRVADIATLPDELRAGAIQAAFDAAGGDYADGTVRLFTCQSCHMPPATGRNAIQPVARTRTDLAVHDLTGGNAWAPEAIIYQSERGHLRLGGPLTQFQTDALKAGQQRAVRQLRLAAALRVDGNRLRIQNLTGHKLITGYPEGRRMWVRVRWRDAGGVLLRDDGAYGNKTVTLDGRELVVRTLLDPEARVYEAHYGMTRDWAQRLLSLGSPASLPLTFDPAGGSVTLTLGGLAGGQTEAVKTFHFVLNNTILKDNRIPPHGTDPAEAARRHALPVPAHLYGGGVESFDDFDLRPPPGTVHGEIELLYQTTSWEYIQFLYLANERRIAFLADEGERLLEAWLNTGMSEPVVMASAVWTAAAPPACAAPGAPGALRLSERRTAWHLSWTPSAGGALPVGFRVYAVNDGGTRLLDSTPAGAVQFTDPRFSRSASYCYTVRAWNDCDGDGIFTAGTDAESAAPPPVCYPAQ